MGIVRSKNRNGRSVQIVVYDLQGNEIPLEILADLEGRIEEFLSSTSWQSLAVTTNVE